MHVKCLHLFKCCYFPDSPDKDGDADEDGASDFLGSLSSYAMEAELNSGKEEIEAARRHQLADLSSRIFADQVRLCYRCLHCESVLDAGSSCSSLADAGSSCSRLPDASSSCSCAPVYLGIIRCLLLMLHQH